MLRTTPSLDSLRHQLRSRVCAHCYRRPRYSESLGAEAVRPCELTCPIFVNLPILRKTAMLRDPMLASRRQAVQHRIDDICGAEVQRPEKPTDDGPLRRYRDNVVNTVLDLVGET